MDILFYIVFGYLGYRVYKRFSAQRQRIKQLEQALQEKRELYRQELQKSAMVGAAGSLAALFFISQLQDQNSLDQQTLEQMEQMDLAQLQQFALDRQLIDQQQLDELMNQIHDPYLNPGLDLLVDESFHGIDHGLGIADHHHHSDHDFGFDNHHFDNHHHNFGGFGGGHDSF
ncbi:hypothetical protein [Desulfofalx alkaliphila]|uniref:hypothetical protein n=1 Tax=Desulfofalx alkaliphila TaxID=105483 RepID=UPI0004E1EB5C|nr:hypothetical protein [Desulfofalx alkaliphila]